jgi:hypothetical protein
MCGSTRYAQDSWLADLTISPAVFLCEQKRSMMKTGMVCAIESSAFRLSLHCRTVEAATVLEVRGETSFLGTSDLHLRGVLPVEEVCVPLRSVC